VYYKVVDVTVIISSSSKAVVLNLGGTREIARDIFKKQHFKPAKPCIGTQPKRNF
jgi:hypothetical protein